MRAVQITRFGGPEVMDVVDLPDPTPSEGQQLYEVSSSGVNFADTHHKGTAQQTTRWEPRVLEAQLPLPDCVGQVSHPLGRLRADRLQGDAARVHALEQADSGAEQHG